MTDIQNPYTPESSDGLGEDFISELLAALSAPAPRVPEDSLTTTSTQLVETPEGEMVPIETTVRYPKGKLYEAAQSVASLGAPSSIARFLIGEVFANPDDRVIEGLSALGYSVEDAEKRVYAISNAQLQLDPKSNPGFGEAYDPYAPFRGTVDEVVTAATR